LLKILAPSSVLRIIMAFTEYRDIPGAILTDVWYWMSSSFVVAVEDRYIDISGQSPCRLGVAARSGARTSIKVGSPDPWPESTSWQVPRATLRAQDASLI
jgi:hypothetical protein